MFILVWLGLVFGLNNKTINQYRDWHHNVEPLSTTVYLVHVIHKLLKPVSRKNGEDVGDMARKT